MLLIEELSTGEGLLAFNHLPLAIGAGQLMVKWPGPGPGREPNNYIYLPLSRLIYLNYFWSIEWPNSESESESASCVFLHFNFESTSSWNEDKKKNTEKRVNCATETIQSILAVLSPIDILLNDTERSDQTFFVFFFHISRPFRSN